MTVAETVAETNILADSIERLVYSRGAMHEAYLTRQDTPKTAGADDFNTAAFDKNLYKFSGCIPFIAPVDECVSHELTESYQGDFG